MVLLVRRMRLGDRERRSKQDRNCNSSTLFVAKGLVKLRILLACLSNGTGNFSITTYRTVYMKENRNALYVPVIAPERGI